jgi:hypothetical protein
MNKIIIPCKLPSANKLFVAQRCNQIQNQKKHEIMDFFALFMAKLRFQKAIENTAYTFDIFMPDKKIDPENYSFVATKCFFDTAQKIGFLPNDNIKFISAIHLNFFIDRLKPRIEITF